MAVVKVVDAKKAWSLDPARPNKQDIYVEYEVEGRRGYWITVPAETATNEIIEAAVKEAEIQRQAILKIEFEV